MSEDQKPIKRYKAHFVSTCYRCSGLINIGDYLTWGKKGTKRTYHVNCANPRIWPSDDDNNKAPEQPEPHEICPNCNMRKGQHKADTMNCPAPIGDSRHFILNQYYPGYEPLPLPRLPTPEEPDKLPNPDELFEMKIPEQPNTGSTQPTGSVHNDSLLNLIAEQVQAKVIDNVSTKVKTSLDLIDRKVQEKLDKLSIPSLEIKRHELPNITLHNVHKQFADVLALLNSREYVYLHGAPGAGKSHLGPQLAEALGVRFGFRALSEQTPEYVVTGFTNPVTSTYCESPFVDFWRNGGLWCMSELDLANDNLRSSLNTMLEQKVASLDCGMVPMHDKFYMYADGNTCGRGAHPAFPSRTAFDAAFAARFVFLEFQYDWPLAKHITLGLNKQAGPIVDWAEKASNWALANAIQVVISPREVYKIAKLMVTTDLSDTILLDGILRGLDVASKEKLLTNYPFPSISRS